jgi:hypothetical protein
MATNQIQNQTTKKWSWTSIKRNPLLLPIAAIIVMLIFNAIVVPDFFKISIQNGVLYGYTIDILNLNKIPYLGVAGGINSINNSPVGLDAMEVVSDVEMRAYGWCVAVNGKVAKDFPNQVSLTSQDDEIVWYYGYARSIENQWLGMCFHANKIKPDQFCKK